MKKRMAIVDLWKFIGAIMVILYHLSYYNQFYSVNYFGKKGNLYVEFFFILTGYFTYRHFYNNQGKNFFESGIKYTVKKFAPFFPYVVVSTAFVYLLGSYITSGYGSDRLATMCAELISSFYDYILEIFLLSSAYKGSLMNSPLWFLSSMLVVFPLVTLLCQLKNKYLILTVSGLFPLFFYNLIPFSAYFRYPVPLFRALAGLLSGVSICVLTQIVKENNLIKDTKKTRYFFTALEIFSMLFVLIIAGFDIENLINLRFILFPCGIGSMFSGYSMTSKWQNRFISYLGMISMPIFIWNWTIFLALSLVLSIWDLSIPVILIVYIGSHLLISILSYQLVEKIKSNRVKKRALADTE